MVIRQNNLSIVFEERAATVLFNFLTSLGDNRPFLLPANVCPIVPLVFMKAKVRFELVDICPETLCMDQGQTLSRLAENSEGFAGVVFIRTYGLEGSFETFFQQIKRINERLIVIDDRCLAVPELKPQHAAFSDLILYSTGYAKIVDLGWGGFGFVKEGLSYLRKELPFNEEALLALETKGKRSVDNGEVFDFSDSDWLVTTEPQCSFQRYSDQVLEVLKVSLAHKGKLNQIYSSRIHPEIQLGKGFQCWRFNIRVPDKEGLLEKLFAEGLFASSHYASLGRRFSSDTNSRGTTPVAEQIHAEVVNLFNDKHYDVEMAEMTARVVLDHVQS